MRIDYIRIPAENAGYFLGYCRDMEMDFPYIEDSEGDLLILDQSAAHKGQAARLRSANLQVKVSKVVNRIKSEGRWDGGTEAAAGLYLHTK